MPLLRVTHQRGAFTDMQKAQLANELTHALLMGEVGSDNPASRAVAYVVFDEVDPKTSWFVGGKLEETRPTGGRFIFDVFYPVGAASQEHKTQLHKDINDSVARVLDVDGTFPNRGGDWVFIHEITEGNWGVSGQTIGVADVYQLAQGDPARSSYFEQLLAAQRRTLEAFNYPAGSPGASR